jgi:hypothetical protein
MAAMLHSLGHMGTSDVTGRWKEAAAAKSSIAMCPQHGQSRITI